MTRIKNEKRLVAVMTRLFICIKKSPFDPAIYQVTWRIQGFFLLLFILGSAVPNQK